MILKVFQNFLSSHTQRVKIDGALVLYYFYCTLLTFQGYLRICRLVMLTILSFSVEFHILRIGHLWQHHWMMIWLWSAIGAVGKVCWWIQAKQVGCLFLVLLRFSPYSLTWSLMVLLCRWSLSWRFWVSFLTPSQSNSYLCIEEGRHFEKDNECFQRCGCCCQMLLGIHTFCPGVLFYSLDVGCQFRPVVAR